MPLTILLPSRRHALGCLLFALAGALHANEWRHELSLEHSQFAQPGAAGQRSGHTSVA